MEKEFDIDEVIVNRHSSKIEFISNSEKVGEESLYRTKLNFGNIPLDKMEITAKDTKDSLNVDIKLPEAMKCTITKDENGYTIVKCEAEKEHEEDEFEYEETPSLGRRMRDAERWG